MQGSKTLITPRSMLLLLLATLSWLPITHAEFIESFVPRATSPTASDPVNYLPYLWQQVAKIEEGGRGPEDKGFHMTLYDSYPAAETVLLQWDKTSPAQLVFYAGKADVFPDCVASVKFLYSTDGINWSELWTQDCHEWSPRGYEPVSVTLPLGDGDSRFAVKWTYTQSGSLNCYNVFLDDITFPAQKPGKPKPAPEPKDTDTTIPKMPPGVAPVPFPATYQATCTWAATYCGVAVAAPNITNITGKANTTADAVNTTGIASINHAGATKTGSNASANTPLAPVKGTKAKVNKTVAAVKQVSTDVLAAVANTAAAAGNTADGTSAEDATPEPTGSTAATPGVDDAITDTAPAGNVVPNVNPNAAAGNLPDAANAAVPGRKLKLFGDWSRSCLSMCICILDVGVSPP